jgi:hypothetical protein
MVPARQKPATGHDTTVRSAPAAIVAGFDQTPAALVTAVEVVAEATVLVFVPGRADVVVGEPA